MSPNLGALQWNASNLPKSLEIWQTDNFQMKVGLQSSWVQNSFIQPDLIKCYFQVTYKPQGGKNKSWKQTHLTNNSLYTVIMYSARQKSDRLEACR